MIVQPYNPGAYVPATENAAPSGRILKMVPNERMGGTVPVWQEPETAQDAVMRNLAYAGHTDDGFAGALSYTSRPAADGPQEFGFGDLIDMANPLQHIPLVSNLYRHVTGDEIRPISRIVGGAVFGGAMGAAASLANVAVEHETGRDIAGNVMSLARGEGTPEYRSLPDRPAERLAGVMPEQQTAEGLSPHFAGFTAGWRNGVFVEPRAASSAAVPAPRYHYND